MKIYAIVFTGSKVHKFKEVQEDFHDHELREGNTWQ